MQRKDILDETIKRIQKNSQISRMSRKTLLVIIDHFSYLINLANLIHLDEWYSLCPKEAAYHVSLLSNYNNYIHKNRLSNSDSLLVCIKKFGQHYCYEYNEALFNKDTKYLEIENNLFFVVMKLLTAIKIDIKKIECVLSRTDFLLLKQSVLFQVHKNYNCQYTRYLDVLSNIKYSNRETLNYYGYPITNIEYSLFSETVGMSADCISKLAKNIVDSFFKSFSASNKRIPLTSGNVQISYHVGLERIVKEIVLILENKSFHPLISNVMFSSAVVLYPQHNSMSAYDWTSYDKHDIFSAYDMKISNEMDSIKMYIGCIRLNTFGKIVQKKAVLQYCCDEILRSNRDSLHQYISIKNAECLNQMDISTTAAMFPLPNVGRKFQSIFKDIVKINSMGDHSNMIIQQRIIDVLDKSECVMIRGVKGNKTDIVIQLQPITDGTRQTGFTNAGSDVNIPYGEIFTTPKLQGTSGVLHIPKLSLYGISFTNLLLTFQNGYLTCYEYDSCSARSSNNDVFRTHVIDNNITVPMSEFALGTNTFAYNLLRKYNIESILPELLIEKLGLHFGIGDTCYCFNEDRITSNVISGKIITSKDNEKTILRKEKKENVYSSLHVDISLPIEYISFFCSKRKETIVEIIKNGLYVLPGTTELNKYLKKN